MSAQIIDGKALAAAVKQEAAAGVAALKAQGVAPCLAVILVGEDPASQVYVRGKINDCAECGILSRSIRLPATATQAEQERRHQRQHHHDHRTFHVVAVADVRTLHGRRVRDEEERFERIERRLQEAQFPAFRERGLDIIHQFAKSHL